MKLSTLAFLFFASLASFSTQADPMEEMQKVFDVLHAPQPDTRQPSGYSASFIRGYIGTKGGMQVVSNATQNIGRMVSKADAIAAISSIGYTPLASSGPLDIYKGPNTSAVTGWILLMYYDAAGNASEVYLLNDTLP